MLFIMANFDQSDAEITRLSLLLNPQQRCFYKSSKISSKYCNFILLVWSFPFARMNISQRQESSLPDSAWKLLLMNIFAFFIKIGDAINHKRMAHPYFYSCCYMRIFLMKLKIGLSSIQSYIYEILVQEHKINNSIKIYLSLIGCRTGLKHHILAVCYLNCFRIAGQIVFQDLSDQYDKTIRIEQISILHQNTWYIRNNQMQNSPHQAHPSQKRQPELGLSNVNDQRASQPAFSQDQGQVNSISKEQSYQWQYQEDRYLNQISYSGPRDTNFDLPYPINHQVVPYLPFSYCPPITSPAVQNIENQEAAIDLITPQIIHPLPQQAEPKQKAGKIKKKGKKIYKRQSSMSSPADSSQNESNQSSKFNENNITTLILRSAASTVSQDMMIQQLLISQCHNQQVSYSDLLTFIAEIGQANYHSLGSLHQLMFPQQPKSIKNVFLKYLKWFLENKYLQLLSTSRVKKQNRIQYIRYKNRFLANLPYHPANLSQNNVLEQSSRM